MKFLSLLFAISSMFLFTACNQPPTAEQLTTLLKENPDILVKAIDANQEVVFAAVQRAAQKNQAKMRADSQKDEAAEMEEQFKNPLEPEISSTHAIMGNKDAPVTIVEYTDFECPYCSRGYKTLEEVREIYGDKVRVVVKNLPLPMHAMAMPAAKRFEAIKLQNKEKAFKFYHEVFANQRQLSSGKEKFLDDTAKKVGADVKQMKKDLESPAVTEAVQKDMAEAQKFGIRGTPGFIVNGVAVRGAFPAEHFKKIIDRHLAGK